MLEIQSLLQRGSCCVALLLVMAQTVLMPTLSTANFGGKAHMAGQRPRTAAPADLHPANSLTRCGAAGSGLTGTAKLDLASKSVVASLSQLQKLANGRALEAAAIWNSRSRQCVLEASAKPHAAHKLSATCAPWGTLRAWQHKKLGDVRRMPHFRLFVWVTEAFGVLTRVHKLWVGCRRADGALAAATCTMLIFTLQLLGCRYNPQTGALWGAYQADMGGVTLAPSYSFAKRAGALAVTRKLAGGQTLRATYALPDRLAVLELANKPFKVRAKPESLKPISISLLPLVCSDRLAVLELASKPFKARALC